jgi:hypothetical protein
MFLGTFTHFAIRLQQALALTPLLHQQIITLQNTMGFAGL